MFKILKNIFPVTAFIFFMISIVFFYFSEENIITTNKSRSLYLIKLEIYFKDLPLLNNDTNNIIKYSDGIEIYKKSKKSYKFEELIKE